MAHVKKNLEIILAGGLFAVVVAAVLFAAFDSEPDPGPASSGPEAPSGAERPAEFPLPEGVMRMEELVAFAHEQAKGWRDDARLTRLYATGVRADGSFDRSASEVQVVFVSPEATQGGEINGWRVVVRAGRYSGVEIWQRPAPEVDAPPAPWCPLGDVVGKESPAQFTLDVHYAKRGGQAPALLAFTTTPIRWLVVADPFTCEVVDRSQPRTDQEQRELDAGDGTGPWFDAKMATEAISATIASSSCGKDGPRGQATVRVTFSKDGAASAVSFLAGSVQGTGAGRCLEAALMQVRVKPWERGEGQAAARFVW
jgi:hypothetical protein